MDVLGLPMDILWFSYGLPMDILWVYYGFPMGSILISYGFPTDLLYLSRGFPVGFTPLGLFVVSDLTAPKQLLIQLRKQLSNQL